jgi:hypothetical protein
MTTDPTSATSGQPTEDELRAAYEAEIKKISVEQVLLENVVTLVNLGMRRTGLAPGTEDERDQAQVRIAIEAVRALLPLVEQAAPSQGRAIRDALSQLQLAYVRIGGQEPAADQAAGQEAGPGGAPEAAGSEAAGSQPSEPAPEPPTPGEPGPAQRSGRLWVPGQ